MSEKLILPNDLMLGQVSEFLSDGHDVTIMTKGNSMLPFIVGDRDSVMLRKMDSIAVGDIVLAEISRGVYVLHRIAALDGDCVTLHGDGNLRGTERCRTENISGTVVKICRPSGRETGCRTARFARLSRLWKRQPYIVRRVILGIYRRLI